IRALVDGKKIIITEASIRRDLRLDDAEGTTCLLNDAIFEELARIGTMTSAIICLANNQKFKFTKYILDNMVKNLEVGVKFYMFPRFVQVFVNHQLGDMSHHKGIFVNSSLTNKVFTNIKRVGTCFSGAITPLFETMMVQAPEEVGEIPTDTQDTPILTQPSSFQSHRKHKSKRTQRKETEVPHTETQPEEHIPTPFHDPLPSGEDRMQLSELMEICTKLSDRETEVPHTETQPEEHIPTPFHDPLPSGEDRMQLSELMEICTKLSDRLKKRVKKLEGKKKKRTHRLKRLYKVELTARVESSEEEEGLGDQEDASKQGRIAEIDANEDLSLIDETTQDQGRMNDKELFGFNDLDGDEVIVDVTASENVEQDVTVSKKEVSVAANEVVTTAESVEAPKPKAKGVTIQEPSECRTTSPSQPLQPPQAKDKGKGIMMKPKKPLKKKDHIALNEKVARKLETKMKAEMEEEERIAREKNETNRARDEEIKNKPPTKAQQKILMCTYMKNMEGYKQKDFKRKSFDAIKKMFDKVYKRVNTFMAMDSEVMEGLKKTQVEVTKGSSKRAGDEIEQESAKRQREDLEVLRSIVKEKFKKTKPVNDMNNLLFQTLKPMFKHHVEDNIWRYQQGVVKVHNWKLYDSREEDERELFEIGESRGDLLEDDIEILRRSERFGREERMKILGSVLFRKERMDGPKGNRVKVAEKEET
nr:hypothetical protein [Tanacetum cinerariifolium]